MGDPPRSATFAFQRSPDPLRPTSPGEWAPSPPSWARVICSEGHLLTLGRRSYDVAQDGTVTPELRCPICGWVRTVRLDRWQHLEENAHG